MSQSAPSAPTAAATLPFSEAAVPVPLPLEASFDGGRLTSDGGLVWLGEAEAVLGICAALAADVPEYSGWKAVKTSSARQPQGRLAIVTAKASHTNP